MLTAAPPKTWTYRLDHDLGFAPNPFFKWCTLACCKPRIRKKAKEGEYIVGMAGKDARGLGRYYPQLIYWMRVDEALTFDDYWRDLRFTRKRPRWPAAKLHMVGDRTYRHENNEGHWTFETSMHFVPGALQHRGGHMATDTAVNRVLIGQTFTYWGASGPALPAELLPLFSNPRGEQCHHDPALLAKLHDFIAVDQPKGVAGRPADWDNPRYFSAG
jgi:hypothetical protein